MSLELRSLLGFSQGVSEEIQEAPEGQALNHGAAYQRHWN
jgi:hypothetical protein